MNMFIPRPCFPPAACGQVANPIGDIGKPSIPPAKPINCALDVKQCIDSSGKVSIVTRDPNNNCQFFPCQNNSVPPPSTGNCKPGFILSQGKECLIDFSGTTSNCCLDKNGDCKKCPPGQQCIPSKQLTPPPAGGWGDPFRIFNGIMHRWIAHECVSPTPAPAPPVRPPICNKRSTSWEHRQEQSTLDIEVTSFKAKAISRSRCSSTRLPSSNWATGAGGPDGICRFDGCNSSSTGSACRDFRKTIWQAPAGSGTDILNASFFVTTPFSKLTSISIPGSRAVNCCPKNIGVTGCKDTSKVTSKRLINGNLSSQGILSGFPRTETFTISAWDKQGYNPTFVQGKMLYDVYLYNIEITLTWRVVHRIKGTVTEFRNENHNCCGSDNLSYAQTPDTVNSKLESTIHMLTSMGFIGAMRLGHLKGQIF